MLTGSSDTGTIGGTYPLPSGLYWLYALQGAFTFSHDTDHTPFLLDTDRYALAYLPKGAYQYRVPAGKHSLFFFMVKGGWLLRHTNGSLSAIKSLIGTLQQQRSYTRIMPSLPIHHRVRQHLLQLLHLPRQAGLSTDAAVYSLLVDLISLSLEDTRSEWGGLSHSLPFIDSVRAFIKEQVHLGSIPSIAEIAAGFQVSIQYLGRIHKQHYGYTLQRYLVITRLKEAFRLLQEERRSPSEVAYRLGYGSLSSFSRQFKQYYGIAPREVR